MLAITELSQTRLAIFVSEAASGRPVRRLPVYAEVVLSPVSGPDDSVYRNPLLEEIAQADPPLAGLMEQAARGRISTEWIKANDERYVEVLKLLYDRIGELHDARPLPPDAAKQTREELEIIAQELELPAPVTRAVPSTRVIPLGMLATDHAGFVSFDLERIDLSGIPANEDEARSLTIDFRVYPGLLESRAVSVISQNRIAPDAIVARIEWNDA